MESRNNTLRIVGQNHVIRIEKVNHRYQFDLYERATEFNEENHIGYFWSYPEEPLVDFLERLSRLTSDSFKRILIEIKNYYAYSL